MSPFTIPLAGSYKLNSRKFISDSNPRKRTAAAGVLNLDDLPDSILEKVLTHLPIRDAAKTSILSKNLKGHWRNIPSLLFDNSFHRSDSVQEQLHYLMDMSQVLLHHRGSIHKFTLSMNLEEQYHSRIDNVMFFLRYKDVHELTLHVLPFHVIPPEDTHTFIKIPSCLFSYQQLRHLDLSHCEFRPPPPTFEGFPHLISIRFYFVNYFSEDDDEIQILPQPLDFVSKCPLLENLYIDNCFLPYATCNLDAPKLKFFHLGCIQNFFFKNTPLLSSLHIQFFELVKSADEYAVDEYVVDELLATKLIWLFECLPMVEYLCIVEAVELMPLQEEELLTSARLPITISHLKVLKLAINFNSAPGILLVIALTICSPNLQKLRVTPEMGWELKSGLIPIELFKREDLLDVTFQSLQELEMDFYGTSMEVEFVKFMVAKSLVLKTITFYYRRRYERMISSAVAKLASASPKVYINLVEVEKVLPV